MAFSFIQSTGFFSSFGGTPINLNIGYNSASAGGTLLVAFIESSVGGTPFKCFGNLFPTASDLAASPLTGSGTFTAGTYFWRITFTNATGETHPSNEVSATIALNGRASLTWTQAPSGCTGVKVYRGTSAGNEDHLITTLGGTASSYTDTGTTGSAATPPTNNTALTNGYNTQPGWEWVGFAGTSLHQSEIWAYCNAPAGIGGVSFTNANNQAARGHLIEFSSTLRYQTVELFPGQNQASSGATSFPASMQNKVGAGELAIAGFGTKFSVNPTGQSWTTPSGWTLLNSQANSLAQPWATYYKITAGVGAVSVTGTYSTSTNMTAWDSFLCVFQETDAPRGRIGVCGINANTYTDQASFGFAATEKGSRAEFDHFMSVAAPAQTRVVAQSAMTQYQTTEGGSVSSPPSGMQTAADLGAQFLWSLKPNRALTGTALTNEKTKYDNNIAVVKQAGYFCWVACIHNEFNLGGQNGPFGNDTNKPSGDPYGTGNTEPQAHANFTTHWNNYQPILAQHGIPSATTASLSSATSASSWQPPAGKISQMLTHVYADTGVNQSHWIDVSPQSGTPSNTDIASGLRNPDNSVPSPPNAPIPLGCTEVGRSGSGALTTPWSNVVSWSHNSSRTGHFRDVFWKRLQVRTFGTATVTNGSTTLADSGNSFTSDDLGHPVRTANVPWDAVITAITNSGHAVMSRAATASSGPQTCTVAGLPGGMILWFENNYQSGNWIHTPGAPVNGVNEDQTGIQKEIAAWQDELAPLAPSGAATLSVTTSTLPGGQIGTPY